MNRLSLKRVSLFLMLALALLLTVGASQVLFAATSPLDGTSWVLTSLDRQLPLPDTTVTLQFGDDGNATGTDGCNRYSVSFTVDDELLTFGEASESGSPGISTMMACPQAIADQAAAYTAALAATTDFIARGNVLFLMGDDGLLASFVSADQSLDDTAWKVTAYNNGADAVVSMIEGTEVTANFDSAEGLSGIAGCNDYSATYLASDGKILIGRIGSTFRFCPEPVGVMEQEAAYLAALQTAISYTIEGNTLEMRDANDAIAVMMTRSFTVDLPEPDPGVATARVIAANGVNVRSGPGTNFPVLGVAVQGDEAEIIGRSADSRWWVVSIPAAPGGSGWVSADFVLATNAADVSVIAAPAPPIVIPAPTPQPWPTPAPWPTPVPTAAPQISFSANPTTINQGECSTLQWNVQNVQGVWVYRQDLPYRNYPQVGQGSQQVCPPRTVTYEMRVLMRDGSVTVQQVTINVTPAAPTNPLTGTAWQAVNFNNGQNAVVSPIADTNLTLRFESASQISGNGGCNTFNGDYSVSGSNIWIGAPATTQMLCAEDVAAQESQYLAALQSASTFRIDGNRLELRTAGDAIAAIFTRQ